MMVGTVDAYNNLAVGDYISRLTQLIARLKEAGIKKIILNEPIYAGHTLEMATLLQEYSIALSELADEETVFVGDTSAYEAFEANSGTWLADGIHPNNVGYIELGKLRATAFKRIMDAQVNPNHSFTGTDGDEHIL